jgi:ligand-binding sensor domain-containing protein
MNNMLFYLLIMAKFLLRIALCVSISGLAVENADCQYSGIPGIRSISSKEYKANPTNYCVIQNNQGLFIIGNLWGLLSYDGLNWRRIRLPNGSSCLSLAKDDKGVIFIGGSYEFGFLNPDSTGSYSYVSLKEKLPLGTKPFSEIWNVYYLDGRIYFCSYQAIFIYDYKKIICITSPNGFKQTFLYNHKIWVAENERGLCYLDNNRLYATKNSAGFNRFDITSIVPMDGQKMLVATASDGLYVYDFEKIEPWNVPVNNFLKKCRINKAIDLNSNFYLFACNNEGIVLVKKDGTPVLHMDKLNGLKDNVVMGAYLDQQNNLWLAHNNGLSIVYFFSPFSFFTEENGFLGTVYTSVIYKNDLYLGSTQGVYRGNAEVDKNGFGRTRFEKITGLNNHIWNLCKIDKFLFACNRESMWIIKPVSKKIADYGVWKIIPYPGSNLLIAGTFKGIALFEKSGEAVVFKNFIKGFEESSRYIEVDELGDIWVSRANRGVFQLRLSKSFDSIVETRLFNSTSDLKSDYDNAVFKLGNDIVVAAHKGIYRYSREKRAFEKYSIFEGVISQDSHVERIIESNDAICVAYENGTISNFEKKNNNSCELEYTFKNLSGNLIGSFESILPLSDSNLLIATQDGITIFDHKKYLTSAKQAVNFKAIVSRVELTSDSSRVLQFGGVNPVKFLNLNYLENALKFHFSCTNFESNNLNRYQFWLEGLDTKDKWSDWVEFQQKEYTNLAPGNYVFHLRAKNAYDQIGEEAFFQFVIFPPWYKTIWAYCFYFILVALTIFSIIKYVRFRFELEKKQADIERQRNLSAQQREHEKNAMQAESEIIRLQNEKLQSDLEQEKLQYQLAAMLKEEQARSEKEILQLKQEKLIAEMQHVNNELVTMTFNLTQKSELLNELKIKISELSKSTIEPEHKKLVLSMKRIIDKGLDLNDDWKRFQQHFDVVHDSFILRMKEKHPDMDTYYLKLSAYLKMRLSTKQIATLMNNSIDAVIKARYRLRTKLQIPKEKKLSDFLNEF